VALPEDYERSVKKRYPSLYFLHGLFEDETSWTARGGLQILENLVKAGEVRSFVVVLPNAGRSFYVNSVDGRERFEDFFIQELVPAIDASYRTIPSAEARGISGTSMGGYGALHLAMRYPDRFGSASAHSAALIPTIPEPIPSEGRWGFYVRILEGAFGSPLNRAYWEANSPLVLAEHPERFASLHLYFDCGDHDRYGFEVGNQLLHEKLAARQFPHEFVLRPGDHGWSYLNQHLKRSLLFHWRCFAKTVPETGGANKGEAK